MKITVEKKKKNIIMILVSTVCTALLFFVVYLTGIYKYSSDSADIPARLIATGFIVLAVEIIFIIVARVKKLSSVLRGYFLFRLIGCIAFVVCLFMRMAGSALDGNFFGYIYNIWTVTLRPLAYMISPFVGVSEFLRKALLYVVITYLAGSAYLGIKKQEKFEAEVRERKTMETSH